jgi:hypothetical protein
MPRRQPCAPLSVAAPSELSAADVRRMSGILREAWFVPPAQKAAAAMLAAGYSSYELLALRREKAASLLPDQWLNNTVNEMRDFELSGRFPRTI